MTQLDKNQPSHSVQNDSSISIQKKPQNKALDNLLDILCGSAAGSAGKVIEYPFDTVKVRLQSQPDHLPTQFNGPIDCFRQTFQREGFTGFYRGVSSPIFGAALENASLFLSYNTARSFLAKHWYSDSLSLQKNDLGKQDANPEDNLPLSALFLCGSFSGVVTSFLLTPIELVKCRMQVQMLYPSLIASSSSSPPSPSPSQTSNTRVPTRNIHTKSVSSAKPPGLFKIVIDVYRKEGVAAFWRGQTGTLFREAGGSSAWFGSYEYVNSLFRKSNNRDTNTIWENMLAGACAGVMFNLSLFPADTIKSRMQTDALINPANHSSPDSAKNGTTNQQHGFWEMGRKIYKSSGIKGLYRGCGITIARAAPSSAIIFVTYENLKSAVSTLV